MAAPSRWAGTFALLDRVKIAVSGEEGFVVGVFLNNSYLVRYRRNDGVGVEVVWAADALLPADGAEVVALKAVA
jgi:hypothetical protein